MGGRTTLQMMIILMSTFAVTMALERGEVLDMSYSFGETTLYWPGAGSYKQIIDLRGPSEEFSPVPWFEANHIHAPEHGGTHIDAPAHMFEGKLRLDDIPANKLVGPAVRIDITKKAEADRDYGMTVKDLQDWEEVNGKIPDGALLFVYTGWGKFYSDRLAYYGSARNDTFKNDRGESLMHFPSVAPDTARWLVNNRQISGLGTDSGSLDVGPSTEFMTHRILFDADIYGMEQVANLDQLPTTGAKVYALPMKIIEGSGAPARIVAVLDEGCSSAASTTSSAARLVLCSLVLTLLVFTV